MPKPWALPVKEVARHYGVANETVYRWIKERRLPALHLPGGTLRVCAVDLPDDPPPPLPRTSPARKLLQRAIEKAAESPDAQAHVYFIRQGEAGPIKIGVAVNPATRLKALQVAHHQKLVLLGTIPGNSRTEREIHRAFKASRIAGEWFKPTTRLLALIAEAASV